MEQARQYPERITRIKKRRDELRWSQQTIVDKVFETGGFTSLGTVKRVLSSNAEESKFKNMTLEPIEIALGLHGEPDEPAVNPVTEKFYQDIILEQNSQLKDLREQSIVKTFFLSVLIAFEAVKAIYDRLYLDAGWFTPGNTIGWVFSACFLALFCAAYLGWYLYRRHKNRGGKG